MQYPLEEGMEFALSDRIQKVGVHLAGYEQHAFVPKINCLDKGQVTLSVPLEYGFVLGAVVSAGHGVHKRSITSPPYIYTTEDTVEAHFSNLKDVLLCVNTLMPQSDKLHLPGPEEPHR